DPRLPAELARRKRVRPAPAAGPVAGCCWLLLAVALAPGGCPEMSRNGATGNACLPLGAAEEAAVDPALCLLLALAAAPSLAAEPPRVVFSSLSLAEAQKLDGRRGRFAVVLDSAPADRGGFVVYDCAGHDDALRSVWLVPGQEIDREMVVDAVLRL